VIAEPIPADPSPEVREAAKSPITHWIGARCVKRPDTWGSEKSLWQDFEGWRQQHKLSAVPLDLFGEILDRLFTREMDGWQGIALTVYVAAARRYIT